MASFEPGEQRWVERLGNLRNVIRQEVIGRQLANHVAAGSTVLDVGYGQGTQALRLVRRGCAVTGVDPSAALLGRFGSDAAAEGLSVELVEWFGVRVAPRRRAGRPGRSPVTMCRGRRPPRGRPTAHRCDDDDAARADPPPRTRTSDATRSRARCAAIPSAPPCARRACDTTRGTTPPTASRHHCRDARRAPSSRTRARRRTCARHPPRSVWVNATRRSVRSSGASRPIHRPSAATSSNRTNHESKSSATERRTSTSPTMAV